MKSTACVSTFVSENTQNNTHKSREQKETESERAKDESEMERNAPFDETNETMKRMKLLKVKLIQYDLNVLANCCSFVLELG